MSKNAKYTKYTVESIHNNVKRVAVFGGLEVDIVPYIENELNTTDNPVKVTKLTKTYNIHHGTPCGILKVQEKERTRRMYIWNIHRGVYEFCDYLAIGGKIR